MRSILLALLTISFLSNCARLDRRIEAAGALEAAREATRELPPYPPRCAQLQRTGVQLGDRLDIVSQKQDDALVRYARQVTACAAWYDRLKAGFAETAEEQDT